MGDLYRSNIADIDISKPLRRENVGALLAEGDALANRYGANVFRGGEPVDLTGYKAECWFIRPSKDTLTYDCLIDGNTLYIDLPAECYAMVGMVVMTFKLVNGDMTTTIRIVDGYVRETQTDVAAGETAVNIIEAVERAEAAADRAEEAANGSGGGTGSGTPGQDGEDGFSPVATVTQTSTGATISITDKSGTTTATITNGKDGQDGYTPVKGKDYFDGAAGKDGVSPTVTVSKNGKVTTLTIKDASGTKTATINDGEDGADGKDGSPGADGKDGTSVTVKSVSESTADGGSNVVTFSDGKTLTVRNGNGGVTTPDYVRTAAEEVAEKIISINGAAKGGASGSAGYTNQLPISTDGAGAVYNGTGWKENTRISSSGTIKDGVGANLTGYMPAKPGDVLRMQGITLGKNGVPSGYTGSFLWCFDGSYTRLGSLTRGDENGDGDFLPTESDDGILTYTIPDTYACTYIRLQVRTISDTSIITINEEINEDSGGATSGADAVPVTFAVLTDLHWNDADAPRHRSACQSMEVVSETAPVDAALFLGDLIQNWTWMSYEDAVVDISNCRKAYADLSMPSLWLRGNHDNNAYPDERISKAEIYTRIARRQHNVWVSNSDDPYGCYGYMDFDASKVRIICVNTSDNDQFYPKTPPNAESIGGLLGAINVTATQLQWIADVALDFSDKTDPAAWGIVVASHIPISLYPDTTYTGDDGVTWECKIQTVSALINAYVNGTTFSATVNEETANADFSSVENRAEMICFVSGHKHAMTSGTINGFIDIVCPNASSAGEKVSADGNTYAKTAIGTVGETAVSFVSIDRANRKIHAVVYGRGYDRVFDY